MPSVFHPVSQQAGPSAATLSQLSRELPTESLHHYATPGITPPSARVNPKLKIQPRRPLRIWDVWKYGLAVVSKGECYRKSPFLPRLSWTSSDRGDQRCPLSPRLGTQEKILGDRNDHRIEHHAWRRTPQFPGRHSMSSYESHAGSNNAFTGHHSHAHEHRWTGASAIRCSGHTRHLSGQETKSTWHPCTLRCSRDWLARAFGRMGRGQKDVATTSSRMEGYAGTTYESGSKGRKKGASNPIRAWWYAKPSRFNPFVNLCTP